MKKLIFTAISAAVLGGTMVGAATTLTSANPLLIKENVELHSRLKEPPIWDTSIVSQKEITDAYIAVAKKYGVTADDLTKAGGNLQTAIQAKMATMLLLCDNANTSKI